MKRSKFTFTVVLTIVALVVGAIYFSNLNTPIIKSNTGKSIQSETTISSKTEKKQTETRNDMLSDTEIFEQAKTEGDWATIEKLGNKGYSKAYYPLALHYYKIGNLSYCKKWCQKAINAGVQTEAVKKLLSEVQ